MSCVALYLAAAGSSRALNNAADRGRGRVRRFGDDLIAVTAARFSCDGRDLAKLSLIQRTAVLCDPAIDDQPHAREPGPVFGPGKVVHLDLCPERI